MISSALKILALIIASQSISGAAVVIRISGTSDASNPGTGIAPSMPYVIDFVLNDIWPRVPVGWSRGLPAYTTPPGQSWVEDNLDAPSIIKEIRSTLFTGTYLRPSVSVNSPGISISFDTIEGGAELSGLIRDNANTDSDIGLRLAGRRITQFSFSADLLALNTQNLDYRDSPADPVAFFASRAGTYTVMPGNFKQSFTIRSNDESGANSSTFLTITSISIIIEGTPPPRVILDRDQATLMRIQFFPTLQSSPDLATWQSLDGVTSPQLYPLPSARIFFRATRP